jgi:hypothetical protein
MPRMYRIILFLLMLSALFCTAAAPAGWQASQPIRLNGTHRYKAFYLHLEVYRYAKADLSDLRIVDNGGLFVPHFIHSSSPRTLRLPFSTAHSNNKTTITVDNGNRLQINTIRLSIPENHLRSYRVLADGRQVAAGKLEKLQLQDTDIDRTTIILPFPQATPTLVIEIDDRDDRPLTIEELTAGFVLHKIVFEDINTSPYHIYFGNPTATAPSYDIERYRNQIEKEPSDTVTLGNLEMHSSPREPLKLNLNLLFNITIGAVSLFLVYLLARQLKQNQP